MNLNNLFEAQWLLDKKIIKEKNLIAKDLTEEKILALQVELSELANYLPQEWKYWSNKKNNYEAAIEEYIDGLHFILSIGIETGYYEKLIKEHDNDIILNNKKESVLLQLRKILIVSDKINDSYYNYRDLFELYLGLAEMLGFSSKEIEAAYFRKNQINHDRQNNGY